MRTLAEQQSYWEKHLQWLFDQLREARAGVKGLEAEVEIACQRMAEIAEAQKGQQEEKGKT